MADTRRVTGGTTPSVAVVIVNYRTPDLVLRSLEALQGERTRLPQLEATVVDGGSGDGSAERLEAALAGGCHSDWVTLLPLDFNGGFGWANNQAMLRLLQRAEPPAFIHLLNPDAVVEPGAVERLIEALEADPGCGAAGSQLVEEDGRLTGSAFRFPSIGREFVRGANTPALGRLLAIPPTLVPYGTRTGVDWVTGASVMIRSEALREAGLFDSAFFLYFEDVELMYRLRRRGWGICHVPESRVVHVGGASTGVENGKSEVPKPFPPYWHRARLRFFALAYGRSAALLAGLAFLLGRTLWRLRRLLGLAQRAASPPPEALDLIRHGLWPSSTDMLPAAADWRSEPGRPPAWTLADGR